jgi:multidrug transporter EmrE-like cation transporter
MPVAKTTKQPTTIVPKRAKPAVEESAESASAAPTQSAGPTSSSVSTSAPVEPTQSKAVDPIIFNTPAPQSAVDVSAADAATSKQSLDDSVGLSEIVASPTRAARTLAPRGVAGRPTQPVNVWEVLFFLFLAATNFYVETFSVYACIGSFAPVPYAIVDVVRRLTMIMFSVFVFRNPITMVNALGVCISLAGVLLYNVVTTRASQAEAVSTGNVQLAVSK